MLKKRAQAGLEFLLVFSILTLFAAAFLSMIFLNTGQGRLKDDQESTEDMANFIQQELILASKVELGYNRSFLLPDKLNGKDYSIILSNYSLLVNTSKASSIRGIPKTHGQFSSGNNVIIKNETSPYVFINP
jgi:hypothetical protein